MFQDAIGRDGRLVPGNEHEPKTFSKFVLVPAHNLP
jgi:hypothetical protein